MTGSSHGVVFMFAGHGCQWDGMGAELLDRSPLFAEHLERCQVALAPHVSWSLPDVLRLRPRARRLKRVDVVAPALFAVSVALAELWRACDVQPDAVVGHSHGEIAAAYVAGGLTLDDAARIVAVRSRLLAGLSGRGAVAAVARSADDLAPILERFGSLTVAADNGPNSSVASGDRASVSALLRWCTKEGIAAARVRMDYASHSPQIEAIEDELIAGLAPITPRAGTIPFYSTRTGGEHDTSQLNAHHWYLAERRPVQFRSCVDALLDAGYGTFIEVSPHPVLTAVTQETTDARTHTDASQSSPTPRPRIVATLRRNQGTPERFLSALSSIPTPDGTGNWETAASCLGLDHAAAVAAPRPTGDPDRPRADRAADRQATTLVDAIAAADGPERQWLILDAVRAELAGVLGHRSTDEIDPQRAFRQHGLDSAGAVELRNRLTDLAGVKLDDTLVYDHPTPAALATAILDALQGTDRPQPHRVPAPRPARPPREPLAIVGMACRFPGGVNNPEDLWQFVVAGGDAIGPFPSDRDWDLDTIYHPDPAHTGTSYVREGGFLQNACEFDAAYFGIGPREATAMDPQQRLLLEVSIEAIQSAGIPTDSLKGTRTGVFTGLTDQAYGPPLAAPGDELEGYVLTGASTSVASGRVAYDLDLAGPAVSLDTACSSSLVALDLAVNSLRDGRCSLALAAGITVMATPGMFIEFSRQQGLAPDGRCKPFSASADGTAWSEGVGVLVLERLSDAQRHGHEVLALVRGSAINHDGATNGLTAPSRRAQEQLIADALADAGVPASSIDTVEAHGTGTPLGDPIELQALLATYGQDRDHPLGLGSVKSNLGHTQAAAGMAGVIKSVMALRNQTLTRTLRADRATDAVDWSAGSIELQVENAPWPARATPRRAAVSSFGISGTNAHVILEEAAAEAPPAVAGDRDGLDQPATPDRPLPWLLSARGGPEALRAQAQRLLDHIDAHPSLSPADIAVSLATSRSPLDDRAVVLGDDRDQLHEALAALASGHSHPGAVTGACRADGQRVAFMFTGQGSQRPGMGKGLYDTFPVFAASLDACCERLDAALGLDHPLRDVIFSPQAPRQVLTNPTSAASAEALIHQTEYTQPGLFATEVALYRLAESLGLTPAFLTGHSIGELAAAYAAGVFSLEDACKLVAARGRMMGELAAGGAMVSVQATEREILATLSGRESVFIAAVNGPSAVVLSGDEQPVLDVAAEWQRRGRRTKRLQVSHAFHSHHMDAMLEPFAEVARTVDYHEPDRTLVSNITGRGVRPGEVTCADYWVRHVRETVRFADGIQWLHARGARTFVEIGPDGVLAAACSECLHQPSAPTGPRVLAASLVSRREPEVRSLTRALGEIWSSGASIGWGALLEPLSARRVPLPAYAFQRQRFWAAPQPSLGAITRDTHYQVRWHPHAGPGERLDGSWLLISLDAHSESRLPAQIAQAINECNANAVHLSIDVAGADRDGLARQVSDQLAAMTDPRGVVLLLATDAESPDCWETNMARLGATLTLTQALADTGHTAKLWAVTQAAVRAQSSDSVENFAQASAWGLGRVASLEHPELWGGLIDLPKDPDERILGMLCGALAAGRAEDQVAIRSSGCLVPRLVHSATARHQSADPPSRDGTVLITGGTGALGGHFARWFAQHGARHIVLASRRGRDALTAAELEADLQAFGADVTFVACDVSNRSDLARLIDEIPAGQPITTIIHAAGLLEEQQILSLSREQLAEALDAKARSALHLHELTENQPISAFVLCSSLAGTLGASGQGAYAAANAYLDALAEHRRSRGLPATSIAWGPWAGAGMAETLHGNLREQGLHSLDTDAGLSALQDALSRDPGCLAVADIDWRLLGALLTSARPRPLISRLQPPAAASVANPSRQAMPQGKLARALADLAPADREARMVALIKDHAAVILGHGSAEQVSASRRFKDSGFDSLAGVRLCAALSAATELSLAPTLTFEHPTPAALATHLVERVTGIEAAPPTPATLTAISDEPIAVVGMACHYPGAINCPDELWTLVANGGDAIAPFPTNRGWDIDALYDPAAGRPGTTYVREAGFLEDPAEFDAAFFQISPREALAIDPQQRLLLQTSWEALEDAAISPQSLRGTATGVFAGFSGQDYSERVWSASESLEGYGLTGAAASALSGRIAYTLDLHGPAISVDTACSSSLVTLHMARTALIAGECSLALAGGVTVMSTPRGFIDFARQQGLARDGRCKPFADAADGTSWSEGVGVLVLERLSDAQRNGHQILALLTGSAVNQDGLTNGLPAPNGASQQRVIAQALASARLAPDQVDVVEAHGTGTSLGDPIEAAALMAAYGTDATGRRRQRPLLIGSIKSNIGHPQAAAGVAGVIKLIKSLEHDQLPQTLHVDQPTRKADWTGGTVALLTEPTEWPRGNEPRRAAASAFGISGTNAHLIIEEAPATPPAANGNGNQPVPGETADGAKETQPLLRPWILSARSRDAVSDQARRLVAHLDTYPELAVSDVALSLSERARHDHRAVILGRTRRQLTDALRSLGTLEGDQPGERTAVRGCATTGPVTFLFTGQGAQRSGMGRELNNVFPAFRDAYDETIEHFEAHIDGSLRDVMSNPDRRELLNSTQFTQPALFTFEIALFRLVQSLGVAPTHLLGHSIGELAAAHVAGVLSLEDACSVVAARGHLMAALPTGGAMVSIQAAEHEVLAQLTDEVTLAAVNGPESVVLSGDERPVLNVAAEWERRGRKIKRLPVSHAFHSPRMDPMLADFQRVLDAVSLQAPTIPIISNVTGRTLDAEQACSARYWVRQVREPVRFLDGIQTLISNGVNHYLEVGPDGALTALTHEIAASLEHDTSGPGPAAIALIRKRGREPDALLTALATAWVHGIDVDWSALNADRAARRVSLPTYPFARQRYWLPAPGGVTRAAPAHSSNAVLGEPSPIAGCDEWLLEGRISISDHEWLADHTVAGTTLLPGTAFADLALQAGRHLGCDALQELSIEAPLAVMPATAIDVQIRLGAATSSGSRDLTFHARRGPAGHASDEEWSRHARGVVAPRAQAAAEPAEAAWPPPHAEPVDVDEHYVRLDALGLEYGPAFQGLTGLWRRDQEVFAEAQLPEVTAVDDPRFLIHPALLDAVLQGSLALPGPDRNDELRVPFGWTDLTVTKPGATSVRASLRSVAPDRVAITITDDTGEHVASIGSLITRPLPQTARASSATSLYALDWVEATPRTGTLASATPATVVGTPPEGVPTTAVHPNLASLTDALDQEAGAPAFALACPPAGASTEPDVAKSALDAAWWALNLIQGWLAEQRLTTTHLVIITHGAVAARPADNVAGLPSAPIWGLIRSAQAEHPGRFSIVDIDDTPRSREGMLDKIAEALADGEPELAIRDGRPLVPRLAPKTTARQLTAPAGAAPWRLQAGGTTVDELTLAHAPDLARPLAPGEIRIRTRAAGVNFRDVLISLGAYPEPAPIGAEAAGEIVEIGPDVSDLAAGDRVAGLFAGGIGPVAVTDQRLAARIPDHWSFTQAASIPIVFLTAYYALVDLAHLKPGDRLLVHAAAGGVGMAAVKLGQHLGAEVFATAHPDKWPSLQALGIDPGRLASSRDLTFHRRFEDATDGHGVDVILNSLTGDLTDASLALMAPGGRFLEMGKLDIRDPATIQPDVTYLPFDLMDAGADRIKAMLAELLAMFDDRTLRASPVTAWDVRLAAHAFRRMIHGEHRGKNVLTLPRQGLDPDRTILITGGTGGLGSLVARHLVERHGARHLLLTSRRGPAAPTAPRLVDELAGKGAAVRVVACDVSQEGQIRDLLAAISPDHPLGTVVHTAAALDDGTVDSLSAAQVKRAMSAKAAAAWHLHTVTADIDLDAFVLFSSTAGVFAGAGQANYAAANSFLDALAGHRAARGLPATSIAWGPWDPSVGMTSQLSEHDLGRLNRAGLLTLEHQHGLELLDAAMSSPAGLVIGARLSNAALRGRAAEGDLPRLLTGLTSDRPGSAHRHRRGRLTERLSAEPPAGHEAIVLDLVQAHTAAVLAHETPAGIDADRAFKELGVDSLSGVELRNALEAATGLRLSNTVIFDHPSPRALARHLLAEIESKPAAPAASPSVSSHQVHDEPVAIVGMSCRLPGEVASPEDLWSLIRDGGDAIGPFPSDRGWNLPRLHGQDGHEPESAAHEGGFVHGATEFDPGFFSIGPRQALAMDPQQRLVLEGCWEALERAAIKPTSLRGSQTGVFVGASASAYGERADQTLAGYRLTGTTASMIPGRVAYSLGLQGPALTIDTACSSSLVALHLACAALRAGECTLALAGGVAIMASPDIFVEFTRQGGLASDGRCKPFSDSADGTGWSEGLGVLVLERLSDAEANGHQIMAVVRGSAVNQDGASNGQTAPNGLAQQRVIHQALRNAGLTCNDIDAIEAHGTGTKLGDPVEAHALLATYGQDRDPSRPLWLGSVKSNIGHPQAAAGAAAVIKLVMALRESTLPPTLHVDAPSREIDWSTGALELLTKLVPWPRNDRPRRAGVSSFGISGTNAHVIIEEPPNSQASRRPAGDRQHAGEPPAAWVLSARSQPALREQASRLLTFLRDDTTVTAAEVAASLAARPDMTDRGVVVAHSRDELTAGVEMLASGEHAPNVTRGEAGHPDGAIAFLFTGQGAQQPGMGRDLYLNYPLFASALDEICGYLDPLLGRSLQDVMFGADKSPQARLLHETRFTQCALFALELAMFRLITGLGVMPSVLIGHSVGELAAACAANVFSVHDACRLVEARARLMGALPAGGVMIAVQASEHEAVQSLQGREEQVALAAVNGPEAVVLSGHEQPTLGVAGMWQERGRKTRQLHVSHAFHSPLMDDMLDEFTAIADTVAFQAPHIPVISNVTGREAPPELMCDPGYWARHVRHTVRFADALADAVRRGARTFLEVGPDAVLSAMARESLDAERSSGDRGQQAATIAAMRQGRAEAATLLAALGDLWVRGAPVDWQRMFASRDGRRAALPTYPFDRRRYWLNPGQEPAQARSLGQSPGRHPILVAAVQHATEPDTWTFTGRLSAATHPWISDHTLEGTAVVPGTAFLELALAAAERLHDDEVVELTLHAPLILDEQQTVQIQVTVWPHGTDGHRRLNIHARPEPNGGEDDRTDWTLHASGLLNTSGRTIEPDLEHTAQWPPRAQPVSADSLYARLDEAGYTYGPAFRGVTGAWRAGGHLLAEVSLPDQAADPAEYHVHPAVLDCALHPLALGATERHATDQISVPYAFSGIRLRGTPTGPLRVRLQPRPDGRATVLASNTDGTPVLCIDELQTRPIDPRSLAGAARLTRDLYQLHWLALSEPRSEPEPRQLALIGDAPPALSATLRTHQDLTALEESLLDGSTPPDLVLISASTFAESIPGGTAAQARAMTGAALTLTQRWLASELLADARLVLLTEGAVAAIAGDSPNLTQAPLVGLLRSAHSEHPDRFAVIDIDDHHESLARIAQAAHQAMPEIAIRAGTPYVPRLQRATAPQASSHSGTPAEPATILVTGGTGALGALVAREVASRGQATHLLLLSRHGLEADGAPALKADLQAAGCEVSIQACDVCDYDALAQAIASISPAHPLRSVVHAAGVLDDGVIAALDGAQLERVLAPKIDAALHLHDLTAGMDLAEMIFFSSAAATIGGPGQANYAAANAFLDALAHRRRHEGLPALSLGWGAWARAGGMAGSLSGSNRRRFARLGIMSLSDVDGLALMDLARSAEAAALLPVRIDSATLREQARTGMLPDLMSSLAPARAADVEQPESLRQQFAAALAGEREALVLTAVCQHVAHVLGYSSDESPDPSLGFKELGVDSLGAVELRNRLSAVTGLRFAATVIFDHPTPSALAAHLYGRLDAGNDTDAQPNIGEAEIRRMIASIDIADLEESGLLPALEALAREQSADTTADQHTRPSTAEGSAETMDLETLIERAHAPIDAATTRET